MSIQSILSDVTRCHKEIASLESKRAGYAKDRATALSRSADAQKAISSSSSTSTIQSKMRDIQRYQDEAARASQNEADIARKIANESEKMARYQEQLQREQSSEARKQQAASRKLQDGLQRRQDELERAQRDTLQNLREGLAIQTPLSTNDDQRSVSHDAFISHASEDKEELVRPLAKALSEKGFSIWYDEFQLRVGDSLRRSIDRGLRESKFGIVILSEAFFKKNWPQYELDGLVAKEISGGKVILPLWHKITKDRVLHYSPTLADKMALNTSTMTINEIVDELSEVLGESKKASMMPTTADTTPVIVPPPL